ncbi:MAG: T9SS type A sorting domain-containing protein [Bacteroidetes bacterium]|nr:T9SS type A sorting domain-containing protein [Bacteroidota bacterium]
MHSESNEEKEINMLNMLGEFITSIRFKNMSEPINISHLSKGVYILMEPQTSEVKKLILQ